LQKKFNELHKEAPIAGLVINNDETNIIRIGESNTTAITIDNKVIEDVDSFTF
jgi:hypothetical protein